MEINQYTSDYLIALLKATIHQEQPPEKPETVEWKDLLNLAVYHQIEEMVYDAVSKLQNQPEGEIARVWNQQHEKNQLIHMIQQAEAKAIIGEASKQGLDILPLKGALMKPLYLKAGFRQMGDLDYLVDKEQIDRFVPLMESLGYVPEDVGSFNYTS